jgi:hypothetical protein
MLRNSEYFAAKKFYVIKKPPRIDLFVKKPKVESTPKSILNTTFHKFHIFLKT